jgi:hypothetical protein
VGETWFAMPGIGAVHSVARSAAPQPDGYYLAVCGSPAIRVSPGHEMWNRPSCLACRRLTRRRRGPRTDGEPTNGSRSRVEVNGRRVPAAGADRRR